MFFSLLYEGKSLTRKIVYVFSDDDSAANIPVEWVILHISSLLHGIII